MNDLDERIRRNLAAVDRADLPPAEVLLGAARVIARHRAARRRASVVGIAVVLVAAAVTGVVVRGGDGARSVTPAGTVGTTVGATAVLPAPVTSTSGAPASSEVPVSTVSGPEASTSTVGATVAASDLLPQPTDGPLSELWAAIPADPRGAAFAPMGAWDGHEVIVVGGADAAGQPLWATSAYDPATDRWRSLAAPPSGTAAADAIIVWTGHDVLVVGGQLAGAPTAGASAFDPATDRWRSVAPWGTGTVTSTVPWTWTGTELLVWPAAASAGAPQPSPLAYEPASDRWTALAVPAVPWREQGASVWTGHEWLLWGGRTASDGVAGDEIAGGTAFDPVAGTWRVIPSGPLSARRVAGVWTGTELVVLDGAVGGARTDGNGEQALSDGAAYDPATDTWRGLAQSPVAHPGFVPTWTGSEVLLFAKGGIVVYRPASDQWDDQCCNQRLALGAGGTPVWTGTVLVVPGSADGGNGGFVFDPRVAVRSGSAG